MTETQVKELKEKLSLGILNVDDIEDTPFINLFDDSEHLSDKLVNFSSLPDNFLPFIYCGESEDGWSFYDSEESLIAAFAKDSKDHNFGEKWIDMDDVRLKIWYERLFVEQPDLCLPLTLDIIKSE